MFFRLHRLAGCPQDTIISLSLRSQAGLLINSLVGFDLEAHRVLADTDTASSTSNLSVVSSSFCEETASE